MRSDLHKELQNKAQVYLLNKGYWICGQEVPMPVGVCDTWGMKRATYGEAAMEGYGAMAVEVKVSRTDFRSRSQRYKEFSSFPLGNFQYVLCPAGMIQPEEMHSEWGLLWWTGERMVNKKKAPHMGMTALQKLQVLIYFLNNGTNFARPQLILPTQSEIMPVETL